MRKAAGQRDELIARLETQLGGAIRSLEPLHGGRIAEVLRIDTQAGDRFVAKVGVAGDGLDLEGWIPFFAEHRPLAMAAEAQRAGQLDSETVSAVETLAGRLERRLVEPEHASLIHGDLWGGNLLFDDGRLVAVIDPACYCASAEVELAFSTLFSTFGERFFARYAEERVIEPGFFEERRYLHNLYPLLVHARLFGGHYVQALRATLRRFGTS